MKNKKLIAGSAFIISLMIALCIFVMGSGEKEIAAKPKTFNKPVNVANVSNDISLEKVSDSVNVKSKLTSEKFHKATKVAKKKLNKKATKVVVDKKTKKVKKVTKVNKSNYKKVGTFRCTAYCGCGSCCGGGSGRTASGTVPTAGRTIATDPSIIPLGSKVQINGHTYIAEDTGGAINGNVIDVFFASHSEALQWGVRYLEVYVEK